MISALRAEFLRLLRWRLLGLIIGTAAAIALLGTLLAHFGAGLPGGSDPDATRLFDTPRGVVAGLFGPITVILGGLGSGLIASMFAADFSARTIRTQLTVHPQRASLLLGKLAAIATLLLAVAAVAVIVASLAALASAPPRAGAAGWYTAAALSGAALTVLTLWLALVSYGTVGFLAAMLIRSPGPATLIGVIYVTGLDGYLTAAAQHVSKGFLSWLPQPNLVGLAEGGVGHLGRALGVAGVFAAILLVAGFSSFVRRDVV
jgi:hypothetical protein